MKAKQNDRMKVQTKKRALSPPLSGNGGGQDGFDAGPEANDALLVEDPMEAIVPPSGT